MRPWAPLAGAVALALALPLVAHATDVDGPDDCTRVPAPVDFGDAPEDVLAYPGVMGHFPTCLKPGAPSNQTSACPAISSPPGNSTGFVRHDLPATNRIWLGCSSGGGPPLGIDSEVDGKVNDTGGAFSACNPNVTVDCVETMGLLSWGQDECYGSNDACLASPPVFKACGPGNVNWTIAAYNCSPAAHQAVLNILVDWNQDGDWNDNFSCAAGCAFEWAVKNFTVTLQPGCNAIFVPTFRVGPNPGRGWMRITLSDDQAPDDFPWNGSASMATQSLHNGETEDYPVTILPSESCPQYEDWGDAPEDAMAYPGIIGHFPTCSAGGAPGTITTECPPALGTPPGLTGYVRHISTATSPSPFWLGCGNAASLGVDSEIDGKMNDTGGPVSMCNPNVLVDCVDFFGMKWGQDECYGDGDAGLASPTTVFFPTCTQATIDYKSFDCTTQTQDAFLNILVDMNHDGDWNDNFICDLPGGGFSCANEWAVKNQVISVLPGCQTHTSPPFLIGPNAGPGWMRITLTRAPVPDDFPWNGSAGIAGGAFNGGETEDYPIMIRPANVGVGDGSGDGALMLAPISPNPADNLITVRFTLPHAADVSLAAYDVAGRKIADLASGALEAGPHQVVWGFRDARGGEFAAGYYVIRLRVGDRVLTQRGIRIR